jgi:hypothetical protein
VTRADQLAEQTNIGSLRSIEIIRIVSNMIADEIEAYAQFLDVEGDLYGMTGGLRKAASIARNTTTEGTNYVQP